MERGCVALSSSASRQEVAKSPLALRRHFNCSRIRGAAAFLLLPPLLFLLLFFFYPLGSIIALSFGPQGRFGSASLGKLVETAYYIRVLSFTLWQAALSTLLTVALAVPAAYVFARYNFPAKTWFQALATVPFVLPTIVVALAFTALLGPYGLVNQLWMRITGAKEPSLNLQYTLAIILLAHIFYNYTVVLRIVSNYWANLDPRLEEAARMLGASPWRVFWTVTLPLLWPAIGAAAVLVFIFCFTSFGVILILGGPRFATLEVEIYRQTIQYLDLPVAAALSTVQILLTLALMSLYTRLQNRIARPLDLRPRQTVQRWPRRWLEWLMVIGSIGLISMLLIVPLAALIARSFDVNGQLSLGFYRQLFENPRSSAFYVPPIRAIRNSLTFALATTVLSVALGLMVATVLAERGIQPSRGWRLVDTLFMLPLGTSAVTLGLGYIVALDEPPLNLRTSPLLVVLAHTLIALPFVTRTVLPALRAIHPRVREAAAILGAPPWRRWREIDLPIVARAVLVGAVFAFTVSMGEFGATSLIARPERPTMPVAIYRFLGRPGGDNYGQALAMSTLLMVVCLVSFVAIERFRVGQFGEF